ncbi:VanZ family protein [Jeotgalibacillus sp. R-1-5s-1]|uniref:VanZ family protein n=1 Tax=Jeotgalibacillus sp. R-1-5s-1 TaxID=2555897 RepID=UPI00106A0D11|nr:VanZ family protein [Jeotgalibacillus sp. R-1-5s-1]TFD99534.1 VanZ family protein [Jeotgalibacillus sp. R-1-5s-1]
MQLIGQQKNKYLSILLGVYIAMLVYFMFFGFGRPTFVGLQEYRYSLIPLRIPLWLPKQFSIDIIEIWVFALGNLLAFIPFGILVPIVFGQHFKTYFKFITLFVSLIVCMEIVQLVTYLGSFDIEDIIINTMGATIGFCSYKISERMNTLKKYWLSMGLSIMGLTLLMFLIAEVFNTTITPYLEKTFGL